MAELSQESQYAIARSKIERYKDIIEKQKFSREETQTEPTRKKEPFF